jgi:hypothetical protein
MNKHIEDFEQQARDAVCGLINKRHIYVGKGGKLVMDFEEGTRALQYYLLDAWNDGYDKAIVTQHKRFVNND